MRRQLFVLTLFVLAIRLPFLNQAIQGDDVYYLYGAAHAQIDPLHPTHARYVLTGETVDMRGHPHPPFDAWYLGGLLALFKSVYESYFHAGFIPFSLITAYAAFSIARRFSPWPLAATLLFLVTPAFVVNGNSLESDVPFLAFWLAGIALYLAAVDRRSLTVLALSMAAMSLAALSAYQSILLTPILLLYGRKWKPAWLAALTAPGVLAIWQVYERSTSGALPGMVLAGYMQTYGLQEVAKKIKNAVALTAHLGWLVFPVMTVAALWRVRTWADYATIGAGMLGAAWYDPNPLFWASIGVGLLVLCWCLEHYTDFLAQWILVFFAAALAIFFAGSARYLLPIGLPLAILVSRRPGPRWLYAGAAVGFALSISMALVNYQHWDGYRQFAKSMDGEARTKRVWVNGEWGLRFYLEEEGALPLMREQGLHPGEIVASSSLAYPIPVMTGGVVLSTIAEREITSSIPLRLVALNGRSAYSTTLFGLRPFDISLAVIDRVRAETVIDRKPELTMLLMNAPQASQQIVSGIYDLENGLWRWMGSKAVVLLKAPATPAALEVQFNIPQTAPARQITVFAGDIEVARQTYPAAGGYSLRTAPIQSDKASVSVTIAVDKTFSVPGDPRELGIILTQVGFNSQR